MNKRYPYFILMILMVMFSSSGCSKPSEKNPNVLFIVSDDLSTALSGYGHRHCKTPNIDRIGEKGITFTRAYNQFPLCGPSRASIMTGQYPSAIGGVRLQQKHFREKYPNIYTLPQLFRERGFSHLAGS